MNSQARFWLFLYMDQVLRSTIGLFTSEGVPWHEAVNIGNTTLIYLIVLESVANPDYGPIFSGFLGMTLVGLLYLSVGMLTSSLTSNQTVAFLSTLFILVLWQLTTTTGASALGPGHRSGIGAHRSRRCATARRRVCALRARPGPMFGIREGTPNGQLSSRPPRPGLRASRSGGAGPCARRVAPP